MAFMSSGRMAFSIESLRLVNPDNMFADYFVWSAIALMERYRHVPFPFDVTCHQIQSSLLKGSNSLQIEICWLRETFPNSHKLLKTVQREVVVENSAVAVAFLLTTHIASCAIGEVTLRGDRADYFLNDKQLMLEISGTENKSLLASRHKEKSAQLLSNPYGKPGFVVVCCFSNQQALFSYHVSEQGRR